MQEPLRRQKPQNRKSQNAVSMRARRNRTLTIDETISAFLSKIRVGPEYVCTVCHRMMYSSNVVPFNRDKYTKGNHETLESVFSVMYVCPDGSQWICHSCDRTLKRGTLPVQALQLLPRKVFPSSVAGDVVILCNTITNDRVGYFSPPAIFVRFAKL